jgi:hypothetical protein
MMAIASLFLGNEWARLAGVAVLCFGFGFVKAWNAHPKVDISAVRANAALERDTIWKAKIQEENEAHETRIAAAIEVGEAIGATPTLEPERLRLCASDPHCRDQKRR